MTSAVLDDGERYRRARNITWVSAAVNLLLAASQIAIGLLAHAQSLVADGFHTLSDLVADFMVLAANYHSRHPPDSRHPYGHRRMETAASLVLGLLLAGTGMAILWSAADRLQHLAAAPTIAPIALWVALATLAAKEGLFRYVLAVGKRLRSRMLVANAWHARADAASSLVVAFGLAGSLAGYRFLDPLAALIVGVLIVRVGGKLAYDAIRELIDTGLPDEELARIGATLRDTPGAVGLHELRTRRMAHQVLADAHIQVEPRISVSEGHRIAEAARNRVLARHPEVLDVLVHVDTEQDTEARREGIVELPPREALLAHLRGLLGEDVPQAEKTVLHYLGRRVEAEVYLADRPGFDSARLRRLEERLAAALRDDPYFRAVSINCRLAAAIAPR